MQYLCAGMSYTDITARVTFFGEFASEEFVEFGAEDTVCDKLALFADLGGHLEGYSKKFCSLWIRMKSVVAYTTTTGTS
jgi:hypothetical protein